MRISRRTTPVSPPRGAAGFTLIELVLSAALLSLILAGAYACLHAALSTRRLLEPRIEAAQSGRIALGLLTADLRAACPLDPDHPFIGIDRMLGEIEADNLDFATHNHTPVRPGEGDYCQVSYFLEPDPDSSTGACRLWRRRNPMFGMDPFSGGRREEIARGVRKLRLEYHDGLDWHDTWGDPDGGARRESSWRERPNLSGMPEAVRVTIWLEKSPGGTDARTRSSAEPGTGEPPLVLETTVRLNLAGRSSSSALPSPASSSTPAGPGASHPEAGTPTP